jgi:hypothetical protein
VEEGVLGADCHSINAKPVRVIWEACQVASWLAYRDLMLKIALGAANELPKLPLIAFTDHTPTMAPQFVVERYVLRPACLPENPKEASNGTGRSLFPVPNDQPPTGRLDDEIEGGSCSSTGRPARELSAPQRL